LSGIGVPFVQFLSALLAGRLLRTLGLAGLVQHGGAQAVAPWTKLPVSKPGDS